MIHNIIDTPIATHGQHNVAGTKQTTATRVPQDMRMEEHVEASFNMKHTFSMPVRLEADVHFAVEVCVPSWGPKQWLGGTSCSKSPGIVQPHCDRWMSGRWHTGPHVIAQVGCQSLQQPSFTSFSGRTGCCRGPWSAGSRLWERSLPTAFTE